MPSIQSSGSQQGTSILPGLQGNYNQLLGLNQANYQNILGAYAQGQQNLSGQLGGIYSGYDTLNQQVQNTLGMGAALGQNNNWGVAQPAATAIGQEFAKQRGTTDQQLINSGLGNTTIRGNLQNQNALFASQAYGGLGAQLAQTSAGYQAQLGQAGLGARLQGLGMQTGLYGQQGGALAGYHFANTAGGLTGGQGTSQSYGSQTPDLYGQGGGGGGRGAGGGGTVGTIPFRAGFGSGGGAMPGGSFYGGYTGNFGQQAGGGGGGGQPQQLNLGGGGDQGADWFAGWGSGGGYDLAGEDQPYGLAYPGDLAGEDMPWGLAYPGDLAGEDQPYGFDLSDWGLY